MGIRGRMVAFIKNYLEDRNFQSKLRNYLHERRTQEEGTPQGSIIIISALLFIIAMDTIKDKLPNEVLKTAFADDLSLTVKSRTVEGAKQKMQRVLQQLEKWSNETGFRFSTEKTKVINFCRRKKQNFKTGLTLYKKKIEDVDSHRFLGVIIDRKLCWVSHLTELKKDCYKKLTMLKYISHT